MINAGMSHSKACYRTIITTLRKFAPKGLKGQGVRRLNVYGLMIVGLIRAGKASLPEIASKSPKNQKSKTQSREQRFIRWLKNESNSEEEIYFPYIKEVLAGLSNTTLIFSIDASSLGKHCAVLMISVMYQNRSLPVVWKVRKGNKGSFSEQEHVALVEQLNKLMQELQEDLKKQLIVVILGDGEFDGVEFQRTCEDYGWSYVLRAAKNINCFEGDSEESFKPEDLAQEGERISVEGVSYTNRKYGPVQVIAQWDRGYQEELYLVTNLELAEEACELYKKRCLIETFFSDHKSRGFNIQKSRLKDPHRIAKLLMVACFAYIWLVYLGVVAKKRGLEGLFARKGRKVLSLFQLGFRYLDYLLECAIPLPFGFFSPPDFFDKSVWI